MQLKFTANTGFFGAQRNRFVQFQPERTLEEMFALVAQIDGMTGIELKYPAAFTDIRLVQHLLDKHDLILSAINIDTKDSRYFRYGALSARSQAARQEAITRLREAMDVAAELGTPIVTTCPLADGYDYPFQIDHATAWGHFIESVRAVASHRPDIRFCLEYQPHEPHSHILLNNVGKMLYVCAEVGLPNVGANFDVGHAFAAQENPAEAAALLARSNRLFYIHTNDNTGDGGDWDMISGAVHFWHWLELLYTLDQIGYDGWLGGDIVPKHIPGPVEAYQSNTRMIQRMARLLERIGMDKITEMIGQDGNVAATFEALSASLIPELDPQPD
jgi:xylose isomerase